MYSGEKGSEVVSLVLDFERLVKKELSGENAKSYVAQIARFHRVQASPMFHEAAEYIKRTLYGFGLEDVEVEQFASDGATKYWTWTSPVGWKIDSAELRLVEPEEKTIVKYRDVPTCVHTYSKGTPPEGFSAELVDVGLGTGKHHYEKKRVKDKFVLATGLAKRVHEQAVYRRGARGVITDTLTYEVKDVRESVDIPDAHSYQSIWPTAQELGMVRFGFSISKRQGNHLRNLLNNGKRVVLTAKVDATLFPSTLDVVSTEIRGDSKPDEEVFFVAHLCHPRPSANDNASGCGLLLELVRTIKKLIESHKIKKPVRTLRFLWVPETFGSLAYLFHHPERASKLIAGVNLDMVGQNQKICKSTLCLDKTPDSNPSYLNDYVLTLLEHSTQVFDPATSYGSSSTFRYSVNPFSGGSDHAVFNDSTFKVPCVMLIQWPDLYYHTSLDSIDKVSEESLKRAGWIAAVTGLTLASADSEAAVFMANLVRLKGATRLREASQKAAVELFQLREKGKLQAPMKLTKELAEKVYYAKSKLEHIIWREKKAVESVRKLGNTVKLSRFVSRCLKDIDRDGQLEITRFQELVAHTAETMNIPVVSLEDTEAQKSARLLIPERLFKGMFNQEAFRRALGEEQFEWYDKMKKKDVDFTKKTYEIVNFMDGKRSLQEIVEAVSGEYSDTKVEHALKFLRDLEKTKLVASHTM